MKTTTLILALLSLTAIARAAEVQLIANPAIGDTEISQSDLKAVFLGTKTSLGGTHVEPVLSDAHANFSTEYLGKSDTALRNYFKSLVFSGKGAMPRSFASDQEVLSYVAKTKGAIGYVAASSAAPGVKKLAVK